MDINEKFDIRKVIITFAGVIIFLLAGTITMFLIPSEKSKAPVQPVQAEQVTNSVPVQENSTSQKSIWFIYVTGAVKNPGVYQLSQDSRIFHAIEAAGGFSSKADETSINLAELLHDEAHIHVEQKVMISEQQNYPARIPGVQANNNVVTVPLQSSKTQQKNSSGKNLVDVNHASLEELQKLNGIGPALAKRIIDYRQSHGKFKKPEDLMQVKGIGPRKLEKMRSQILIR